MTGPSCFSIVFMPSSSISGWPGWHRAGRDGGLDTSWTYNVGLLSGHVRPARLVREHLRLPTLVAPGCGPLEAKPVDIHSSGGLSTPLPAPHPRLLLLLRSPHSFILIEVPVGAAGTGKLSPRATTVKVWATSSLGTEDTGLPPTVSVCCRQASLRRRRTSSGHQ